MSSSGVLSRSTVSLQSIGKVEYGQGTWTALAQMAAEELPVTLARVRVAPVSTRTSPDEGVTAGSLSVQDSGSTLRQACAQARGLLLAAAAARLGLPQVAPTPSLPDEFAGRRALVTPPLVSCEPRQGAARGLTLHRLSGAGGGRLATIHRKQVRGVHQGDR